MRKRVKNKKFRFSQEELMNSKIYEKFLQDFLSSCENAQQITTIIDTDYIVEKLNYRLDDDFDFVTKGCE